MFDRAMSNDHIDAIGETRVMQDRVREIRTRYCKPESNANPRYLALSNVVNLTKATTRYPTATATSAPTHRWLRLQPWQ